MWDLCAVNSRGRANQLNLIHLVALLLHKRHPRFYTACLTSSVVFDGKPTQFTYFHVHTAADTMKRAFSLTQTQSETARFWIRAKANVDM